MNTAAIYQLRRNMNETLAEMLVRSEISEPHIRLIREALALVATYRRQASVPAETNTKIVHLFRKDPVADFFQQLELCLRQVADDVHIIYDMVMAEYDIIGTKYSGKPLDELFAHNAEEYREQRALVDAELVKLEGLMANKPV